MAQDRAETTTQGCNGTNQAIILYHNPAKITIFCRGFLRPFLGALK
nr:MAG TPA: hypothetical protein [Caudoviricetes sp.]